MPKKSKPKPRTNWKQRAQFADERCSGYSERLAEIHGELDKAIGRVRCCEEVLSVARKIEMRLEQRIIELAVDRDKYKARAETAEKRNDDLIAERQASRLATLANLMPPIPTHWQRFKSWWSR